MKYDTEVTDSLSLNRMLMI